MREWLGAAVVIEGMRRIMGGAAELEAAIGGTETVFKDQSAEMLEWAENASQAAGLSEKAAIRFAAYVFAEQADDVDDEPDADTAG